MQQTDNRGQHLIYFHTPSQAAKEFLFYPLVVGVFERDKHYRVHRLHFDSVMLAYVTEGRLLLRQGGGHFCAEKGELLLVDCYQEHEYYTDDFVKFTWLHLDGGTLRPWLESMIQKAGPCIKGNAQCHQLMLSVIDGVKNRESEYHLSQKIHTLMCRIASLRESVEGAMATDSIRQAKEYMEEHLEEKLTVRQIAEEVHYSPSYFSQIFQRAEKTSPYDYLLSRRIERAKVLLLQTEFPLEIVAARSGFQGVSHFIYAFKKATGLSPLKFRKLEL